MADDEEFAQESGELDEAEEHEESEDEVEYEMHTGDKEADPYSEEGRDEALEGDEAKGWEEGFARGATAGGGKCAHCNKILGDDTVDKKVGKKTYMFCSTRCANKGAA